MWLYRYLIWSKVWSIGYFKPDGQWEGVESAESQEAAAARVMLLNGAVTVVNNYYYE